MKDLKVGQTVYLKGDDQKTRMTVEKIINDDQNSICLVWMTPQKKLIRDKVPGDCLGRLLHPSDRPQE